MGVRKPGVKGELGALDGQAQRHQQGGHHQRQAVLPRLDQPGHRLLQSGKQQLSRDAVQHSNAQQHQTGTQTAEDQIPDGGHHRAPALLGGHRDAGGHSRNLHKHIAGEQVVGIHHGQQRPEQQLHQQAVPALPVRPDVPPQILRSAAEGKQHHYAEGQGQQGLQGTRPQLVAPGGRNMPHGIGEAGPRPAQTHQQQCGQPRHTQLHPADQPQRPALPPDQGDQDPADQGEHDAEKGDVIRQGQFLFTSSASTYSVTLLPFPSGPASGSHPN